MQQTSFGEWDAPVEATARLTGIESGSDRARSTEILPWSHTIFSNLKAWLLGTFRGVSKKLMHRYLDEFIYRFNHRWRETELFGFVLRRAVRGEPWPYSRLTAELLR